MGAWDWLRKETWRYNGRKEKRVNCENQWRKEECTVVAGNEGHVDCCSFGQCDCETLTL